MNVNAFKGSLILCLLLTCWTISAQEKKTDKFVTVKESEVRQWATELRACDLNEAENRILVVENARYKDDLQKKENELAKAKEGVKYLSIALGIALLYFILTHYFLKK